MKLSYERIRAMTWGAVHVAEEDGGVAFHRFTEEEERLYAAVKPEHSEKALASSGIRLVFRTDSPTLKLAAEFLTGTSRVYYSLDVEVNGAVVGSLDNYSPMELIPNYTTVQLPLGEAEAVFDLGEGEKDQPSPLVGDIQLHIFTFAAFSAVSASTTPIAAGAPTIRPNASPTGALQHMLMQWLALAVYWNSR